MADDPVKTLQTSKDGPELVVAALQVAKGADGAAHEALRKSLQSPGFLLHLDRDEDYNGVRGRLRLASVMRALTANPSEHSRKTLLTLTRSEPFLQEPARIELLIEAGAELRPASDEFVAYWDRVCDPKEAYTPLVIAALLDNGTPPALALFEKKMADAAYDDATKIGWLRKRLLPHRYEPPVLEVCQRMIAGSAPAPLRPHIVEALFDFRPEWYKPNARVTAPDVAQAGGQAQAMVRAIGQRAIKDVELSHPQRAAVERVLERMKGTVGAP